MPVQGVQQLYERLNRLEEIYELNEYPLSTPCPPITASLILKRGRNNLKHLKEAWKRRRRKSKAT
jgi:hypothetical protein